MESSSPYVMTKSIFFCLAVAECLTLIPSIFDEIIYSKILVYSLESLQQKHLYFFIKGPKSHSMKMLYNYSFELVPIIYRRSARKNHRRLVPELGL